MKEKEPQPKNDEEAQGLKEKGNELFKQGKYEEAVLHYTHAIKLDPNNYSLYSNRSSAFLHLQQFYLALGDAKDTIRLQPGWAKGYFRKGEVEYQTFNFDDALLSYQTASLLQPQDTSIQAAIERTKLALRKDRRADDQIPWLGAGIGIIIGATIVIADHILTEKPSLAHPIAMVLVTIAISLAGYAGCRIFRSNLKSQRASMLDPPVDLLAGQEPNTSADEEAEKTHPRYSKAQARQRFKKGKS